MEIGSYEDHQNLTKTARAHGILWIIDDFDIQYQRETMEIGSSKDRQNLTKTATGNIGFSFSLKII